MQILQCLVRDMLATDRHPTKLFALVFFSRLTRHPKKKARLGNVWRVSNFCLEMEIDRTIRLFCKVRPDFNECYMRAMPTI